MVKAYRLGSPKVGGLGIMNQFNKIELIKNLENKMVKIVKSYQSDFEHDKTFINDQDEEKPIEFIYQLRESGTQFYNMGKIEKSELNIKVKYLFGYSTKTKILNGYLSCIRESFPEDKENFYHVKNNQIKKIDRKGASLIFSQYINQLHQ
jgi:hypothetical protein